MIGTQDIGEALNHVLGNTCRMARTAKSYEWNARGHGAVTASSMFRRQAAELHEAVDPIAELILGLGLPAILDYTDLVLALDPPATNEIPGLPDMIGRLSVGHEQSGLSILAAIDVATEAQEHGTIAVMAGRINAHRHHRRDLILLAGSLGGNS